MADGTHIPGTPACVEWEAQLADAQDGLLCPEEEARFIAHKAICPACAELYEEAGKGRAWLEYLSPEPEPPEGLLERILATTGPGSDLGRAGNGLPAAGTNAVPAYIPPVWQQTGFLERMRTSAQPRLLMTAAMAFFSIALTLNLTGVQVTDLRLADLRPHAVRAYVERQLTMASVPIVRYYDHLRFVHEVAAQVRELRNQNEDEGSGSEQRTQPAAPGESRNRRVQRIKGAREQAIEGARQQGNARTGDGAGECLETSVEFPIGPTQGVRQCEGYRVRMLERSSPWIA